MTRQWLAEQVDYHDDTFPGLLRIKQTARQAAEKIMQAITWVDGARVGTVLPVLRTFDPVGSTAEVDFFTTKIVFGTSPDRCHINFVTLDGPGGNDWERAIAKALDTMPGVAAYAKNDHLGFSVPYTYEGITRQYLPDFLVRLDDTEDDVTRTLIVEVSGSQKSPGPTAEKATTTRTTWVPAVNAHGAFGLWGYCEIGTAEITRAKKVLTAAMAALRELDASGPPIEGSRLMPPRRRTADGPMPVEAVHHADKRVNIPTADAKDFVSRDAAAIDKVRYPRDPSLDPQLVWKGKDEQDSRGPGRRRPADLHPGEDRPPGAGGEPPPDLGRRGR